MKLSFAKPHLSIREFPEIELPEFVLITGVNGAGKTHLLRAIEKLHVKVDIASNAKDDIRFFDSSTLVPNNTGEFNTASLYNERDTLMQWVENARTDKRDVLQEWATTFGVSKGNVELLSMLRMGKENLRDHVDATELETAWEQISAIGRSIDGEIKRSARNNEPLQNKIEELRSRVGGLAGLQIRDFEDEPFGWGRVNLFQQSFAQLFLGYFELKKINLLHRLEEAEGRLPPVTSLSDAEFIEKYGDPPWEFVNRTLRHAGLSFEIDYPVEYTTTKFTPRLRKTTSGAELQFSDLSSGERILMSFAFCLYYSEDRRQAVSRPKLLLFDEIDAPLHPSMSRQLIDTIRKSLVQDQQVQVLMTTHSPTTVAVAPEQSIYVMRPGSAGLHKVGKRQAIAVLTSEIPTLSIDFEGRRQVFVESRLDAERYEALYRILGANIPSERSLAFIAVGRQLTCGDDGAGCGRVIHIVNELVANGNDSVFGLIDWDCKNEEHDRIVVLGRGARYAVENFLLDPVLIFALLVSVERGMACEFGLPNNYGYLDLKSLSASEWQRIVDNIQLRVLGLSDLSSCDLQDVTYVNGMSVKVAKSYLLMRGHDLEKKIMDAIPSFKQFHRSGELLGTIIKRIVFDMPGFAPREVLDSLARLLA